MNSHWILAVLLFVGTKAGEEKEAKNDPLEDWMFTELKQCSKPPPVHQGDKLLFDAVLITQKRENFMSLS